MGWRFENRGLRRIFGPKRDEVTGEWRKLHKEELHVLCCSPRVIRIMKARRMKWVGHVARMREKRNAYRLLVGKPEGRKPLGRPRCRWSKQLGISRVVLSCMELVTGSHVCPFTRNLDVFKI
jgi:hypothetical protein